MKNESIQLSIPLMIVKSLKDVYFLCSLDATGRLEQLIEQAERESKILANEINQWLIQESGSSVAEDDQTNYRSRRSDDEDEEDVRTDTNLSSDIGRLIMRRDASKHEDNHKKKKNYPDIKRKGKRVAKESHNLSKKHGLQADQHHVKKGTTNKKEQDKKKALKAKRVSKQRDKKPKHKTNSDEISKENLVKALIGGDARAKNHKEQTDVPEKAYRALVEFMARSEHPIIETGIKKSDIAKPKAAGGKHHPRSSNTKQGIRRKLTKKHRRVLAILSKMPQSVLHKYFHLKGLDKYWKVIDNIRRKQAAKEIGKKKVKMHKDEKIIKELKDLAPKKAKTSTHPEKIRLLQEQTKSHQKNSKQTVSSLKLVKDEGTGKMVKDERTKKTEKEKAAEKIVKDKTTEKLQKPSALHSPSSQKSAKNVAKQTQIESAHLKKEQSHKTAMEQHAKVVMPPQKDVTPKHLPKEVKSKGVVKVADKIKKNDAGKNAETSKATPHIKDATSLKTSTEKPKSPVQNLSKKEAEKKVSLKPAAAEQATLTKGSKEKDLNTKDKPARGVKAAKVNASQLKSPASVQAIKSVKLQTAEKKDLPAHEIKIIKEKPQLHTESLQHQLKAVAPNVTKKVINQNSSAVAHDKPKEIPKALAVTEHQEVRAAHAPQNPEVKQEKGSQVKQQSPGTSKIDILKEKIQKTNTLKFKVAQALLAHCETQNRLRQVFEEVNSSLKKAASLAKAIGTKFGIEPSDVEKMTSEHTEGAVEQFLNKLF